MKHNDAARCPKNRVQVEDGDVQYADGSTRRLHHCEIGPHEWEPAFDPRWVRCRFCGLTRKAEVEMRQEAMEL